MTSPNTPTLPHTPSPVTSQPWLTPVDEDALLTRGALKLGRSQQLLLDGRSCDDWASEKNWAPMPYGAQLYMSRSYAPQHEVVHVGTPPAYGHEREQAVKVSLTTPTPQAPQPPEGTPEGAGELRGGSPWVEMRLPGRLGGKHGRQLVAIGHTKEGYCDTKGRCMLEYQNRVMLADPEPPFAITSVGPPLPLDCLPRSGADAGEKICFASGLAILEAHVLVSYGSADEMAKMWVIGRDDFVAHYLESVDGQSTAGLR